MQNRIKLFSYEQKLKNWDSIADVKGFVCAHMYNNLLWVELNES